MTAQRGETARKGIHVAVSLGAAIIVWRLPAMLAAALLAGAAALALATEVLRLASPGFEAMFRARLGPLLRPRETRRLTGATTLALGYTLAAVLLPGRAAIAGILFAGIADAIAAVVGRRWGRHRYRGGKSAEGSAAFFAAAAAIAGGLGAGPAAAGAVALTVTILEAPTFRIDDNLYLPVAGAAVFRALAGF
ncbi:MAG TPA: hypothetical protein VMM12_07165 [Longimicrobiales bacterium]|nr:hypothetical protein [Longimicrobiales bacterium]